MSAQTLLCNYAEVLVSWSDWTISHNLTCQFVDILALLKSETDFMCVYTVDSDTKIFRLHQIGF